jgi:hypothetical protein
MYQATLQKLASIPLPSAVRPERIAMVAGQTLTIKFPHLPKTGRGFFIEEEASSNGATYTSEIQEIWSPLVPGETYKIHGIKTPGDLNSQDIVFATENTIYVLRNITESDNAEKAD